MGRRNTNNEVVQFADAATSPTAAGELQRNGRNLLFHDTIAAMQLSKDEYYDRQHLHFGDFSHWSANAPASGSITRIIGRARITIDAPVLSDWAEIYALLYKNGGTACDIDSKPCSCHCRLVVTEDDVTGGDKAEETCGYVRYIGANAQIGFLVTFQRVDATDTIYYRFYPFNDYWSGAAWLRTTGTCVKTLTFAAPGSQSTSLFFYSNATNLYCYVDDDPATVQTIAIGDDLNENNAEVDFYLANDPDYNLDMEINQLTFVREF